jgi:uncharacterized protein YwqG
MFKEVLCPLADNAWLALTTEDPQGQEPPTQQTGWAYAKVLSRDGSTRDVLELLSLHVPADLKRARETDGIAAGQREMAEKTKGTKSEACYVESALQYAARAEALRKPTLRMPMWLNPLSGSRILCAFHVHRRPAEFRLVDLEAGDILATFDGAAIHEQIFGGPRSKSKATVSSPEQELRRLTTGVDFDVLSKAEALELTRRVKTLADAQREFQLAGIAPLKLSPLAASDDRLLLNLGLERAMVAYEGATFRLLAKWPCMHGAWPVAARTAEGFLFHCTEDDFDRDEVLYVRSSDGAELGRWPSKRRRVLADMGGSTPPGRVVALSALGGKVTIQHGDESSPHEIPAVLSVDKYDPLKVGLSPDARFVAMARMMGGDSLALYDRDLGYCAVTPFPAAEIRQDAAGRQVRLPGFALTEDEVLVIARGEVSRLSLADLTWHPPIKPAPRIRKLATPALTLEQALETGPLAEIAAQVRSWFRPSVVLVPKRLRADGLPTGSSKAGGLPDLEQGCEWPRYRGAPMAFLLQLNLADVASVEPVLGLPGEGLLSVFLALDDSYPIPSFFSDANSDLDGCRVIFTPAGRPLDRIPFPIDTPDGYRKAKPVVCGYTCRRGGSVLPDLSNDRVQRAALSPIQSSAYRELVRALNGDDDAPANLATRVGGYPALLQNDDLHLQAESYSRGDSLHGRAYEMWEDAAFQQSAQQWRQLFQLPEGKEGWTWGDAGLMHVAVREDQWRAADFSPAWGIGVCH